MGQFTLSMHVVNPLRSDNLIGIACLGALLALAEARNEKRLGSLEPGRSLSVVAGARNHLDLLLIHGGFANSALASDF
jgi:hypothetical protein